MNASKSTRPPIEKQTQFLETFLDCLFAEMDPKEEIPFWASTNKIMGFPKDEIGFLKALRRSRTSKACYFGTSTMYRDSNGKLFNRQSQFAGFYVVVLDDIGSGVGSKIIPSDLPPGLVDLATYRVETSPNNEQWGFALDQPIRNLEIAKAFQREIIQRSGADSGGCMPNKLVRLPMGVNLKEKYQTAGGSLFECSLLEFHSDRFSTPEELLIAVDAGSTWNDLLKHRGTRSRSRKLGTTAHRATPVYQASLAGVVDPVLEWLNESKMIVSERGEWVDILCPWASEHTAGGGQTAGYAPIGVGSQLDSRGFHCFHDSCSSYRTGDFLAFVLGAGGPRSSPKSPIEALICRYAFDMESNRAVDLKSEAMETCPHAGFKNQLSAGVFVPDASGKMRSISEYSLYMSDPHRLRLAGCVHQPGGDQLIPSASRGYPRINLWRIPDWGTGHFDPDIVEPFETFIRYLIPDPKDAEWFLDHLAAKAQDPLYRGAGVIFSTPVEGTGRGTLIRILAKLWGAHNVASVTLSNFLKATTSADNNSWIVRDWIAIAEAKETNMSAKMEMTAYESLKTFIEPGAASIQVKEKWAITQQIDCYGCTIVCSQHSDVIPVDSGSTRFRRIANPLEPMSVVGFEALNAWMESSFESHIWRWFRTRDLSSFDMRARQEKPSLREDTIRSLETLRSVDAAIGLSILFAEERLNGMVFISEFVSVLKLISGPLGLDQIHGWEKPVLRGLRNKTRELIQANGRSWRPRLGGEKQARIRATTEPKGRRLLVEIRALKSGTKPQISGTKGPFVPAINDQFRTFCRSILDIVL